VAARFDLAPVDGRGRLPRRSAILTRTSGAGPEYLIGRSAAGFRVKPGETLLIQARPGGDYLLSAIPGSEPGRPDIAERDDERDDPDPEAGERS
jgi:hypothetical protein